MHLKFYNASSAVASAAPTVRVLYAAHGDVPQDPSCAGSSITRTANVA
jgi:hypothetical protein